MRRLSSRLSVFIGSLKRTSKLNRSAVGWIQTACFVKNYDLEVTVLSTAIYYAAASRGIDKARLELLLACAIWMAQKFCGSRSMTRGEALELASGKFSNKELALMESALFDILEHDLIVETVFQYVAQQRLAPEVESGVNFLLELLLLKDGKILFDEEKAHALIDLVEDPVRPSDTLEELRGILSWKQAELLRNKYLSSFEVDQLIKKLSK